MAAMMEDEIRISYETYLKIDKCIREEYEEHFNSSDLGWMHERFIKDLLGIVFPSRKIILERPLDIQERIRLRSLIMSQDVFL